MASSQVEIVYLRPTFGCILRDRNRRQNDDNDVVFLKNLKAHVKTTPPIPDENSHSWIRDKPRKKSKSRLGSPEKPRTRKANNFSGSTKYSKRDDDSLGGASSLVQIWEARLTRSTGGNSPIHGQFTEEIHLPAPSIDDGESESENESKTPDLTAEIRSGTLNSVSDSGGSKWGRVAEMIRRLSNEQKLTAGNNGGAVEMPIVKTPTPEKMSFPVVTRSPRLRGRQALSDFLTHLERDRHRELESLLKRNAVSRFTQRGRLQSMLRLRSLKRGLAIQERHRSSAKTPDLNRVLHLREKFRVNAANDAAEAKQRKGPPNRKVEEVALLKKEEETKSKMISYLKLQETLVAEALKTRTDKTSITHQEPEIMVKEEANKVEISTQGTGETLLLDEQETSFSNEWEEQEEYEDEQSYYGEMSYDWLTEISRPRSHWEDLRKSRYLEVMNTRSDGDDICKLLERGTVSDFLQSGLREKIDNLLMSRVQTHPAQRIFKEAGKEEEKCGIGEEEDEERDDLSETSSQIFAPSPAGSWSSQDTGVTSTPLNNLHSTEMEIISDLRTQILQLQQEMSELRDSVKTCLDVNASLQKSVHLENPLKRKCCVCNETQVETLLYRCGHMCTCLRCANELQCNGGKCPICHAKILDVVRVFVDSRT
ncbi:unnamed protein product [Microthlaspi erraticum]|uniref:RING-type domain-containing protein n=1 Tax=Microthlaspi erraticum TaxID=1685480 RepID=A0A6D2JBE5_9BRAS|nr:unnamed protein product [Microthlaspi erraticum]